MFMKDSNTDNSIIPSGLINTLSMMKTWSTDPSFVHLQSPIPIFKMMNLQATKMVQLRRKIKMEI